MNSKLIHGVGRRKSSVARVWIKPGKGKIEINGRTSLDFFPTPHEQAVLKTPLRNLDCLESYDIDINLNGGGIRGQLGAARLGISRGLANVNSEFKQKLKAEGLLTVDSRRKERKKPGQPKARKKFQFVKR